MTKPTSAPVIAATIATPNSTSSQLMNLPADDVPTTAAPFSGRVGPNERVVPGVQAPDGSLDYFVDETPGAPTLYESDFVLTDVDGPVEVGPLTGIDHVCLALPADVSASLRLRSSALRR